MRFFVLRVSLLMISFLCSPDALAEERTEQNFRISRPQAVAPVHFSSYAAGISIRWWRQFKNPSFCPYVLCASSCAYVAANPRLGALTQEEYVFSEITPCSLNAGACSSCCASPVANNIRSGKKGMAGCETGAVLSPCCLSSGNNNTCEDKCCDGASAGSASGTIAKDCCSN